MGTSGAEKLGYLLQSSNAPTTELICESTVYAGMEVANPGPVVSMDDDDAFSHTWTVFAHSVKPMESIFLMNLAGFDPYAEFRINSVQKLVPSLTGGDSDQGMFHLFPNNWLSNDGSEMVIRPDSTVLFDNDLADTRDHPYVYRVTISVETAVFGTYDRMLVIDFGELPKLGTRLVVDPEFEIGQLNLTDNSDSLPQRYGNAVSYNNAVKFKSKTFVPFQSPSETESQGNSTDVLTDFEKKLLMKESDDTPSYSGDSRQSLSKVVHPAISETWTRANYREVVTELLHVEESTRKSLLDENSVIGLLSLCDSYNATLAESLESYSDSGRRDQVGELKWAPKGELFGRLKLGGCLSEDNPAGRLLCQQTETAVFEAIIDGGKENGEPISEGTEDSAERNSNEGNGKLYECKIADKGREYLYLMLSKICVEELGLEKGSRVKGRVGFRLNRLPFAEMKYGVRELKSLHVLFPEEKTNFRREEESIGWNSIGIMNRKQLSVVREVTRDLKTKEEWPTPIIVTGPFGTGKTFTLAQAAKRVLMKSKSNKLLICTQSNSAADLYIRNYFHEWHLADKYLTSKSNKFPRPLRVYYVGRWLSSIPQKVKDYCCLDFLGNGVLVLRWPNWMELKKSRLIITTLSTAKALMQKVEPGSFTHILIDEAGQATEPQTLIPLCLAGPKTKIVLAGDPLQSGAECYSMVAKRCGLGRSLLERLWGMYPDSHPCKIHLTANYRSHKTLLRFMSENFYKQSFLSCYEVPANPKYYPLSFVATRGIERQNIDSTAYYNNAEAMKTVGVVEDIVKTWPKETWGPVKLEEIGIFSVYLDQIQRIRSLLKKKGMAKVSVERVQNVQGKEYKVVILSTVRTLHTCNPKEESLGSSSATDFGFLSDPRLLNTALTRAQTLVVVVGDAASLCSIGSCKQIWRKFVREADREGSLEGTDWDRLKSHFEMVEKCVNDKDGVRKFYWNPMAPEFRPKSPFAFENGTDRLVYYNQDLKDIETYRALIGFPNQKSIEIQLPVELVNQFLPSEKKRNENKLNGELSDRKMSMELESACSAESGSSSANKASANGSPLVAPPPPLNCTMPPPVVSPSAGIQFLPHQVIGSPIQQLMMPYSQPRLVPGPGIMSPPQVMQGSFGMVPTSGLQWANGPFGHPPLYHPPAAPNSMVGPFIRAIGNCPPVYMYPYVPNAGPHGQPMMQHFPNQGVSNGQSNYAMTQPAPQHGSLYGCSDSAGLGGPSGQNHGVLNGSKGSSSASSPVPTTGFVGQINSVNVKGQNGVEKKENL